MPPLSAAAQAIVAATSRRDLPTPSNAATAAGDARAVRRGHGALLRARAVRAGPRRGLARLGPGRAHVHRLRQRRRRHRAGSLPPGDGQGDQRAGGEALARLQLVHQRAGAAARQAPDRHDLRRARVLLQFRRRGERGGAEARPPLRARPLRRAQAARRVDAERIPRAHAVHGHRRRAGEVRQRLRSQPGRLRPSPVQRRRRARSRVRRARPGDLRGHPRADAGRRRHAAGNARVPAGGAAPRHRARRAADPGRDPERHGTHRRAVLVHAEGHHARHPDQRQGPGRRLPDRRDADDDRGRRARSRSASTARPTAATRSPARSPARCSTSSTPPRCSTE